MFGLIPFRMTRGNNTTISSLTDQPDKHHGLPSITPATRRAMTADP